MLKAADRSNRLRTDDLEFALASCRVSAMVSRVVFMKCPVLKPDWLSISRLFCDREQIEHNSFKTF